MEKPWKCPVDGQEFATDDEIDDHIQKTGHVMYDDLEDKGKETPKGPDDLSYSKHSGYTPGVSSGDVSSNKSDIASKRRVQGKTSKR